MSAETTSDEAGDETDASLALSPWGQRFLTPETEVAYRAWYARRSVPLVRGAGVASAIAWALVLIPTWFAGRVPPALPVGWVLFVIYPSIAAVWWTTLRPHRLAWLSPSMMVATSLSGFTAVGLAWLSRMEAVSLAGVVVSAYFATASVRLRPEQAAAAVVPYVVLHQVWMLLAYRSGTLAAAECAMYSGMPWVTLQIAVYSAIGLERGSREAFRQERVIEAQKRTIAHERARSEALLKQELGHQVAARSRELGQILATSESAFIVGSLSPGDRFDTRYVVERALGAGGMGAVFEVRRITDGQRLALKIVTGLVTGAQAARFAREAEIGARVHHPHVVSIVDVGVAPGRVPFLVMELAEGGALEDVRARFGDARWALPILQQIAEGLAALHQAGVVHRDLKPANVLFVGPPGQQVAKISDFGISRFGTGDADAAVDALGPTVAPVAHGSAEARAGLTATGTILGTPLYMAPESLRGGRAVDAPADVFAFGIIAYEMLTGSAPFAAPPVYLAMAGTRLSAPRLASAGLAPSAITLLERCLATAPEERPTMRAVCEELAATPAPSSA